MSALVGRGNLTLLAIPFPLPKRAHSETGPSTRRHQRPVCVRRESPRVASVQSVVVAPPPSLALSALLISARKEREKRRNMSGDRREREGKRKGDGRRPIFCRRWHSMACLRSHSLARFAFHTHPSALIWTAFHGRLVSTPWAAACFL